MTKFQNETKTTKTSRNTNSNLLLALHTQFRALRFVTQTHICLRDAYAKQIFSTEQSSRAAQAQQTARAAAAGKKNALFSKVYD